MAPMLTTTATAHLLTCPFAASCDGVVRHVVTPSLSLCSGLESSIRWRDQQQADARGCGAVGSIGCRGDWRTGRRLRAFAASATEDCSPQPSDVTGEHEDLTKCATSFWKNWQMNGGDLKEKVAKLGRAGLLAYGLFNAITYTTFFFIAFLAFEKTGQNPANNLKACLGGMISMWTGNNFTRPLRVAGAAALAPFMDKVLKTTQKLFNLVDEASAFLFLVVALFVLCGAAVGLLILSRLGR